MVLIDVNILQNEMGYFKFYQLELLVTVRVNIYGFASWKSDLHTDKLGLKH